MGSVLNFNESCCLSFSLLGFELRRKGKTIPSTDLLIASISLYYDLDILHADNHFEIIKLYSNLKTTDLNKI